VAVVVQELKVATQDHILAHHKALQVELDELTALTAQTGTGQAVAEAALGVEVVVVMAAMVVAEVVQVVLQGQALLDLMPVKMVKINPQQLQIP
jgi:hypothetical protein